MVAKSARLLAPLALAAVIVGVYLIVHAGLAKHDSTVTHGGIVTTTTRRGGHRRTRRPKYYVVRAGDTLSTISVRTHVGVNRLLSLNPLVSPNSLQTGQRLKLRR
jgi:LysM repeat protein